MGKPGSIDGMSKVPVAPPSGFRDFLPSEAAARLALIDRISAIYQSHGFHAISISVLENLSTLQGKGGGSDNEKLIFKVLKRGDELTRARESGGELADLGLRFDLTLPLARYCARFRENLPKPFKVYQIGPVWRADRPQKGRYREFFQCDVDIVGAKEIGAEVDCLSAILEVFVSFGLSDVELHLNDRRLLAALKDEDLNEAQWAEALVSLDKLDRLGRDGVEAELQARLGKVPLGIAQILNAEAGTLTTFAGLHAESTSSLGQILALMQAAGFRARFNPTLVRGQDYYTGTIFEVRHSELAGSLGGGGRYNRLLEIFGGSDVPAFGGSIGFERLVLLLQEQGKLAQAETAPQVFFPLLDEDLRGPVFRLASALREKQLRVDVYPDAAKLKNQFKYADDRKIPFVAILGSEEWKNKQIKVKTMADGSERSLALEPLPDFLVEMERLCSP